MTDQPARWIVRETRRDDGAVRLTPMANNSHALACVETNERLAQRLPYFAGFSDEIFHVDEDTWRDLLNRPVTEETRWAEATVDV